MIRALLINLEWQKDSKIEDSPIFVSCTKDDKNRFNLFTVINNYNFPDTMMGMTAPSYTFITEEMSKKLFYLIMNSGVNRI